MMLNVAQQKQSWFIGQKSTHIPSGLIVSVLIFLELLVVIGGWKYKENVMTSSNLVIDTTLLTPILLEALCTLIIFYIFSYQE